MNFLTNAEIAAKNYDLCPKCKSMKKKKFSVCWDCYSKDLKSTTNNYKKVIKVGDKHD